MTSEFEKGALTLIELFATLQKQVLGLAAELSHIWGSNALSSELECSNLNTGPVFQLWLELVHSDDLNLLWSIEVHRKDEKWAIVAEVDVNGCIAMPVADRTVSFRELCAEAPSIMVELVDTAKDVEGIISKAKELGPIDRVC